MGDSIAQPLLADEVALLSAHEAQIERGLQTFYEVGAALLAIRDQRLYREGYSTFEAYCRERWGMNRAHAYRLVEAAEIMSDLSPMGDKLPTSERQARPLAAVAPDERAEVWREAVETAPNGKVTAAHVQAVVDARHEPEQYPRHCPYCNTQYSASRSDVTQCPGCGETHAYSGPRTSYDIKPGSTPAGETANHQRINLSTSNEWYTPRAYVDAARAVMGGIDLDPASCAFANQTVQAKCLYTQNDDGYALPWAGTVWLNPPYGREDGESDSNQARWTRRAIDAYRSGEIEQAIILVNAVPGNVWFAPLWDFPICMVARRIRFYNEHVEAGQPTHSNAIIYLGSRIAAFVQAFTPFGPVVSRLAADGDAYYPNLRGEA